MPDDSAQRSLSSRFTPFLKFLLPPIWIAVALYGAWILWARPDRALSDFDAGPATALRWLILALIAASFVVMAAFAIPLKRVTLTPEGLRVSNFVREITIPFSAIARVRQPGFPTFRVVALDLRDDTPLGRRVMFMPRGWPRLAFWRPDYWREDEVVAELRRLAGLTLSGATSDVRGG